MKPDEFDRVLMREAEIIPSSGFAKSVMAAVRSEATVPPPIPFPWKRAMPGLAASAVAIGWGLMEFSRAPVRDSALVASSTPTHWLDGVIPLIDKAQMFGAGWVLVGLLLTFAGLKLTWHLAGGRL